MSDPATDMFRYAQALVSRHEGIRLYVYDDATGELIRPGSIVKGHPTIGYGLSLDIDGITSAQAVLLRDDGLRRRIPRLQALDWFRDLSPVRQAVVVDMSYNVGVVGVSAFVEMIKAIRAGDFTKAGQEILRSTIPPGRARELADIMTSGVLPAWAEWVPTPPVPS